MQLYKYDDENIEQLVSVILSLESTEELRSFLEDICTTQELIQLAQRLRVAKRLIDGEKYREICKQEQVSSATVTRINAAIDFGTGGYRNAFDKAEQVVGNIFDRTLDHRKNCSKRWEQPEGRQDVIGMGTADLDYFCAPCIKEVTGNLSKENTYNYRSKPDKYFRAIINWFERKHGMKVERNWITDFPGTIAAIRMALDVYCRPGQTVIMQSPYFMPLRSAVEGAGCRFVENSMVLKDGRYELDFEDFEEKMKTYRPTVFLLVSPHNPVGRVFSREELARMVDICVKYDCMVISDEVHAIITYDGIRHVPIFDVSEQARKHSILVFSYSKGFNVMGLPHALVLIADEDLRKRWDKHLFSYDFHYAANAFSIAAITAVAGGLADEWLKELTAYLQKNRDLFMQLVKEKHLPIKPLIPEASFLFWIDCRDLEVPADDLDRVFLEDAGIGLNNGLAHGEEGRGFVRLNFGVTEAVLREAVDRLEKMFAGNK